MAISSAFEGDAGHAGGSAEDGAVLVGAGDIAACDSAGDDETAKLVDGIPEATVFTTGDNAYESGGLGEFEGCYAQSWGRHKDRTYPSPDNHDFCTGGAEGYFRYFGERVGPEGPSGGGRGYYSYDLGGYWHVVSLSSACRDTGEACAFGEEQLSWLREDL